MAINIHDLKEMIDDHMSDQPYSVKCGGCGGSFGPLGGRAGSAG